MTTPGVFMRRLGHSYVQFAMPVSKEPTNHINHVHKKERKVPCEHCESKFRDNSDLKRHMRSVHFKL